MMMTARRAAGVVLAALVVAAMAGAAAQERDFVPVTDAVLADPAPGDWLSWRRTVNGWGYSPLDQVNRDNVGDLRMVWTRALAPGRSEGTPLAYNGVLYMPQASDVIEALDAASGDLVWSHRRNLPEDVYDFVGGNSANNRNIAIYDRYIVNTSDDSYIFGLDVETGEIAWETQIFDFRETPAGHSSGPIIADGKAISGRSCRPAGGPETCVIIAHDARTGEEVWRRRTIPAPGEPGDETWGGVPFEQRVHVGAWMPASYDPELRLVYQGTSVTSPAPKFMLGGVENTHLYHNSTLALDVDTGEIRWHYQHLNDHWDLDHPFERLLLDTAVAPDPAEVAWINPRITRGEVRKVMTGIPGKTGLVYTLDRETGEFLWAKPTVPAERHQRHRPGDRRGDGKRRSHVHRRRTAGPCLSQHAWWEGLGGRRLQPAHEHDVHAAPQHVSAAPRHHFARCIAPDLRALGPARAGSQHGSARLGPCDQRRDWRDYVAARAAGGDALARGDRRRPRVRRRCGGALPRVRSGNRRSALGNQPRIAGLRLPDQLRG